MSGSLFVTMSLIYGIAAITFSILISVIFRKPALAIAAVVLIWFGLGVVDYFLKPALSQIGYCFFSSLNIFTAFRLGVQAASSYETRCKFFFRNLPNIFLVLHLGWLNMFADSTHEFSVGFAMIMLIVDICIMSFFIFYLDAVVPTDDSPRKSPFFIFPVSFLREGEGIRKFYSNSYELILVPSQKRSLYFRR